MVQGLSCSVTYEVFPDQGWNPCPRHWQVDSYPLSLQGSPDHLLSVSMNLTSLGAAYKWNFFLCVCVCDWLILFSMKSSSFIHAIACSEFLSFLRLSNILLLHWNARKSNQSIISQEYSLEGLMLKLKLQYFGHLMRRTDSLEKTLMLGKIEGGRSKR